MPIIMILLSLFLISISHKSTRQYTTNSGSTRYKKR